MLFFIALGLLLAAVCVGIMAWGLRGKRQSQAARDAAAMENIEALRTEYRKLEKAHESGAVSDDEFSESRSELERRILDESRAGEASGNSDSRQRLMTVLFLLAFVPVAAGLFYVRFGTWDAFDPQIASARGSGMHEGHSMAELDTQLQKLEESLKENPENVNGWMLLARTNDALKRFDRASAAYEKLAALVSGDLKAEVLADWADTLAAQTQSLSGRPEELVDEALKISPKHWKALALKGTALYNRDDFKGAAAVWERLLREQQPGTEEYQNALNMVNDARQHAGLPPAAEKMAPARMTQNNAMLPAAPGAGDAFRSAERAPAAAASAQISGTVSISADLAKELTGDETVFIFARPVEGSRMPVALMQIPASRLPAEFTLDSSMRLAGGMAGAGLETLDKAVVGARVSKSGNLMPQAGDLEGLTPAVAVGSRNLTVKITRKIAP